MPSIPKTLLATLCCLLTTLSLPAAEAADPSAQDEVSARGALVMPFDLKATTHVFTKTQDGGIQQVVAKNAKNDQQIQLIRQHLVLISEHFGKSNFAEPTSIHGPNMPGLAELRGAKPGEVVVQYQELPEGGQIRYSTRNPLLVQALHKWFDAQLSDHGADATAGHDHTGNPYTAPTNEIPH